MNRNTSVLKPAHSASDRVVSSEGAVSPASGQPTLSFALSDPTKRLQRLVRERDWLADSEEDIRKEAQAYALRRRSMGLLGKSVRKQMSKVMATLPGEQMARICADRRRRGRLRATAIIHLVVQTPTEWRLIPAEIVDVSQCGLRILVTRQRTEGEDSSLSDQLHEGALVVVAFGDETNTRWVPAEVVRAEQGEGRDRYLGLEFATLESLQAFM